MPETDVWGNDDASVETPVAEGDTGTTVAAGEPKSSESAAPESERLRLLQSERDSEKARANKLEKELAALKKGDASAIDAVSPEVLPPQAQEWIRATQERYRDSLYEATPEFRTYNLDPSLITGSTPGEMSQSAKTLTEFVRKVEGEIRNAVLREHGWDPEPRSSTHEPRKSAKTMDSKEFHDYIASQLGQPDWNR